jgi:anti-sigma B factor antagonist
MQFSERNVNGIAILDVSGDFALATETPRSMREKVIALLQRGDRLILLNLRHVLHTDSSFLAEIVESYKAAVARGGILRLAHADPRLRSVLHTTSLDSILNPYPGEDEALASFQQSI